MMSAIQIELPDETYAYWQKLAHRRQVSIGQLAGETLIQLTAYAQPNLDDLDSFSDGELRKIVQQIFNPLHRARLDQLLDLANKGQVTITEIAELDHLTELSSEYLLVRSKALALLKERGQDIQSYLYLPKP
jgi:hypothetical protein